MNFEELVVADGDDVDNEALKPCVNTVLSVEDFEGVCWKIRCCHIESIND